MLRFTCSTTSLRGFTLVELLLALGVSALIAVATYVGLSVAIEADEGLRFEAERLSDIQRSLNIIEEDLSQVRPRNITAAGANTEPAFIGGSFSNPLLLFTRGGLGNPARLKRSEMLRVRYRLVDGLLWRQYHHVLDGVDINSAPESVVLLNDVKSVKVEFLPTLPVLDKSLSLLNSNPNWLGYWDSEQITVGQQRLLPIALRLTIDINDFGQVIRVIELP